MGAPFVGCGYKKTTLVEGGLKQSNERLIMEFKCLFNSLYFILANLESQE